MPRGGVSTVLPWHAEAEEMLASSATIKQIAERCGVTNNTIIGWNYRRKKRAAIAGAARVEAEKARREEEEKARAEIENYEWRGTTLFTRLDALHAKFDRTMEELKNGPSLTQSV